MTNWTKPAPWHLSRVSTLLERRPVPEPVRELSEAHPDAGCIVCGHCECSCVRRIVAEIEAAPKPEPGATFVVGQWVKCVDAGNAPELQARDGKLYSLVTGQVYEVSRITTCGDIGLVECCDAAWAAHRFVPADAAHAAEWTACARCTVRPDMDVSCLERDGWHVFALYIDDPKRSHAARNHMHMVAHEDETRAEFGSRAEAVAHVERALADAQLCREGGGGA